MEEVTQETHDLLTVQEVARIFCVDDTTVRRWARQGTIEVVPLSNRGMFITRASVDAWLHPQQEARS